MHRRENICSKWIAVPAAALALTTALAGCRGETGPPGGPGVPGEPCTIVDNGDGTATLTCSDGSVVIDDGDGCTVADNGNGTYSVDCGGTVVIVSNGADGDPGDDGIDGTSCSIADNGDGSYTLSCSDGTAVTFSVPNEPVRVIDRSGLWVGANADRLDDLIVSRGLASSTFDPANRPVAVFDWDNTVMKNDIGDQTMFFMLDYNLVLQPDWATLGTAASVSPAAASALDMACGSLALPGEPLPTATGPGNLNPCGIAIFDAYFSNSSTMGPPWADVTTTTTNYSYAFLAHLLAGYRPDDIRDIALWAYDRAANEPSDPTDPLSTRTIGTTSNVPTYVRIYDEMYDLIGALQDNGFDVWAVSASPQHVVEAVAALVGIDNAHVIGIRNDVVSGFLSVDFEECIPGLGNALITFDTGKRCWIKKEIFGVPTAALNLTDAADPRLVFVAGDSDTDIAMLKDASYLKLAINRKKTQIMCNAYNDYMGLWIVQPMFINPASCATASFACSMALDHDGILIVNEVGDPMLDAVDSVCTLPPVP